MNELECTALKERSMKLKFKKSKMPLQKKFNNEKWSFHYKLSGPN
jgi:hypothetical protein